MHDFGLCDRRVQMKKLTSLLADLWSLSVFWSERYSWRKSHPKSEVAQYVKEIFAVPEICYCVL